MTHDEIVAVLHRAHIEHLGLGRDPYLNECGQCAMYAEWVKPLIDQAETRVRSGIGLGWPGAGAGPDDTHP